MTITLKGMYGEEASGLLIGHIDMEEATILLWDQIVSLKQQFISEKAWLSLYLI